MKARPLATPMFRKGGVSIAGKKQYDEASRARIYATLLANGGNVRRTARETGVPESSIRTMRKQFDTDPPSMEAIEQAVGDFIADAKRVRNKAVLEIERQIDAGQMKGAALVTVVGVLDDKITRIEGVVSKHVVDHVHHLPSADEARELISGLVQGAIASGIERQAELEDAGLEQVEDAEYTALVALPSA